MSILVCAYMVSGQVFAYGEYWIEYVAYDAEGNSATCEFTLFVIREYIITHFACQQLERNKHIYLVCKRVEIKVQL